MHRYFAVSKEQRLRCMASLSLAPGTQVIAITMLMPITVNRVVSS
ncbi:MAG: hypothetical protein ACPLTR_03520 [Thermacetogeniaceae bacterium]